MERICVVGPSGSGKSTVARALGERYGVPVVHLDTLYWKPGWVESDPADFDARVLAVVARQRWVIDGNYSRTLPARLARADLVVFLDMPLWLTFTRIVTRRVRLGGHQRPDMAEGCPERLDVEHLRWAWRWARDRRPALVALLETISAERIARVRSRAEVRTLLARAAP